MKKYILHIEHIPSGDCWESEATEMYDSIVNIVDAHAHNIDKGRGFALRLSNGETAFFSNDICRHSVFLWEEINEA